MLAHGPNHLPQLLNRPSTALTCPVRISCGLLTISGGLLEEMTDDVTVFQRRHIRNIDSWLSVLIGAKMWLQFFNQFPIGIIIGFAGMANVQIINLVQPFGLGGFIDDWC